MQASKGQWVQIHDVVLKSSERAPQTPEDTRALPLEMWVKGYIVSDAELNSRCTVITPSGRSVEGVLVDIEPGYSHSYGEYVPELDTVRRQVREMLAEVSPKGAGS